MDSVKAVRMCARQRLTHPTRPGLPRFPPGSFPRPAPCGRGFYPQESPSSSPCGDPEKPQCSRSEVQKWGAEIKNPLDPPQERVSMATRISPHHGSIPGPEPSPGPHPSEGMTHLSLLPQFLKRQGLSGASLGLYHAASPHPRKNRKCLLGGEFTCALCACLCVCLSVCPSVCSTVCSLSLG